MLIILKMINLQTDVNHVQPGGRGWQGLRRTSFSPLTSTDLGNSPHNFYLKIGF